MKVILINGPPRSGKDTLAKFIENQVGATCEITSFKDEIISAVNLEKFFKKSPYEDCLDFYERVKDEDPRVRQLMITYAENCIKPIFGNDYFAKQALNCLTMLKNYGHTLAIFPDLGFIEEYQTIEEVYGEDVIVVKVQREGFDFSNDSRTDLDIETDVLINNTSLKLLEKAANKIVNQFKLRQ